MILRQGGLAPAISLRAATVRYGEREIWSGLDLVVEKGEMLVVLGPNGAGKTTFLKVLLGLVDLSEGTVEVAGLPPRRGRSRVGYVPQQKRFGRDLAIRGWDLVRLGIDGGRPGLPLPRRSIRHRVEEAIEAVGASSFAMAPIGSLSGGEQQRLRIAQAMLSEPEVLLCDEPLLSLDLSQQRVVIELIDTQRRERNTAVVFVTHDINPLLPIVDRVLYVVGGRWAAGAASDVLTGERLSALYGTPIEVVEIDGRTVVLGAGEPAGIVPGEHHHHLELRR
ncbi:MAG: metal ABC transporter ATP-binding protein [Acidimicrobiales bacterium]